MTPALLQGTVELQMPGRIVYGRPAGAALRDEMARLGVEAALIVTTPSLVDHPYLAGIKATLGPALRGVFTGMTAHTPESAVLECALQARAVGAQILIAVGGGSAIDGIKIVRLCLDEGYTTSEHLAAWRAKPSAQNPRRTPVLTVPTTLSGAEFSGIAGVLDPATGVKNVHHDPALLPEVVILDPEATATAPDWLVLSSGIRAVDHCVETVLSVAANPYEDAAALHGLKLLIDDLPKLRAGKAGLAARLELQFAMWLAMTGPSIGVPMGASHAIGRALGGAYGIPHGRTSCIMLPAVLEWNSATDALRQDRLRPLFPNPGRSLADCVRDLVDGLGEPSRLRQVDIAKSDLERAVAPAWQMLHVRSVSGNARPITSEDQVRELLALAW
jgi:alcohol dehydrogenase class IV